VRLRLPMLAVVLALPAAHPVKARRLRAAGKDPTAHAVPPISPSAFAAAAQALAKIQDTRAMQPIIAALGKCPQPRRSRGSRSLEAVKLALAHNDCVVSLHEAITSLEVALQERNEASRVEVQVCARLAKESYNHIMRLHGRVI